MKHYRSTIPKTAQERIIATFPKSRQKREAEYLFNGKVVGVRRFHEGGELEYEYGLKDGLMHGISYRSDVPGHLLSAAPYVNGLPHGTARQWSHDGKLIGTYRMKRGTGIDFWWQENDSNGIPYLSEMRHFKGGKLDGFEWWLNEDQRSIWSECHFREDQKHGIERSWNRTGRLSRGYPRYWVNDRRVTKRQYLRRCSEDASLPRFREVDNRPNRRFPPH